MKTGRDYFIALISFFLDYIYGVITLFMLKINSNHKLIDGIQLNFVHVDKMFIILTDLIIFMILESII